MAVSSSAVSRELAHGSSMGWMPLFERFARKHGIPLELLLAVASQESRIGTARLLVNWRGDYGHGRGLMQIDDRWHRAYVAAHRDDDHAANIDYGAALLASEYRRRGTWPDALTAYNSGTACWSKDPRRKEACRRGRSYAAEVLERWAVIKKLRGVASAPIRTASLPTLPTSMPSTSAQFSAWSQSLLNSVRSQSAALGIPWTDVSAGGGNASQRWLWLLLIGGAAVYLSLRDR